PDTDTPKTPGRFLRASHPINGYHRMNNLYPRSGSQQTAMAQGRNGPWPSASPPKHRCLKSSAIFFIKADSPPCWEAKWPKSRSSINNTCGGPETSRRLTDPCEFGLDLVNIIGGRSSMYGAWRNGHTAFPQWKAARWCNGTSTWSNCSGNASIEWPGQNQVKGILRRCADCNRRGTPTSPANSPREISFGESSPPYEPNQPRTARWRADSSPTSAM